MLLFTFVRYIAVWFLILILTKAPVELYLFCCSLEYLVNNKMNSNVLWSNGFNELFFSETILFQDLYLTACVQDKYLRL